MGGGRITKTIGPAAYKTLFNPKNKDFKRKQNKRNATNGTAKKRREEEAEELDKNKKANCSQKSRHK